MHKINPCSFYTQVMKIIVTLKWQDKINFQDDSLHTAIYWWDKSYFSAVDVKIKNIFALFLSPFIIRNPLELELLHVFWTRDQKKLGWSKQWNIWDFLKANSKELRFCSSWNKIFELGSIRINCNSPYSVILLLPMFWCLLFYHNPYVYKFLIQVHPPDFLV